MRRVLRIWPKRGTVNFGDVLSNSQDLLEEALLI